MNADAQQALDAHNNERAEKGCPPLEWDQYLSDCAQQWAQNCASRSALGHADMQARQDAGNQGENLYWSSVKNQRNPFTTATQSWMKERANYVDGTTIQDSDFMNVGHYTQAMWKDTSKVGFGTATGQNGTYVCARYSEWGNFSDQTPY